jgi:DNA primase
MGTALTERQAVLLQRQANRVVLAMDSDEAGSAANLRGMQVVAAATARGIGQTRRQPLDIRVLALPQGKDRRRTPLRELAQAARPQRCPRTAARYR